MTEARRGDPHADCRSESPMVNRGKKQPGDGQGTIRRFGNGYDRARTSLKIARQRRRSRPHPDREGGSARRGALRREDNQAEADQQCHDPGDEYCTVFHVSPRTSSG